MDFVKCVACPCREQCIEEGQCLNTWVTGQPRTYTGNGSHTTFQFQTGTVQAEPVVKAPRPAGPANRPAAGTTTGRVWAIADELALTTPADKLRAAVLAQGEREGINRSTLSVQFGKWRAGSN